jgi:hypothetical protein
MVHSSEMSLVQYESTGVWPKNDDLVYKAAGSKPGSNHILARESSVLNDLAGKVGPKLIETAADGTLKMTRLGTHDLSDVMHDLRPQDVQPVISEFIHQVNDVHQLGYVHRDIKPGNLVLKMNRLRIYGVVGLVDFGMSLRINRKQDEKAAIGGTEPYSHPTQLDQKFKSMRAHPGQDWYALGRSILHLAIGGNHGTLRAFIDGCSKSDIDAAISEIERHWSGTLPSPLAELIRFSVKPESATEAALDSLETLGQSCVSQISRLKQSPDGNGQVGFQKNARARPKRHDILFIIDSTGSMVSEITDLKSALKEVVGDIATQIDLRIDLWSMGDYGRADSDSSSVIPLGERMRGDTFKHAVNFIDANRDQHDEAEAYEVALQKAYEGNSKFAASWCPRKNTLRTIVLIGDAYAHGWLKRNYWASHFGRAYKGQDAWKGKPAKPPDPALQKEFEDFQRRHEIYISKENRDAEAAAFRQAKQSAGKDEFGGWGHVEVKGERHQHRPNFEKAIAQCVNQKGANIHTISAGKNRVNHSFMKYVAMKGGGSYTHIEPGELKLALTALMALADPAAFDEFESKVRGDNPQTQALYSITQFKIDSEEGDSQ